MRLIIFHLFVLSTCIMYSQAPAFIPYQAVARDASGQALVNLSLDARFTILDGSPNGEVIWQELQFITTNNIGLFNAQLGTNTSLDSINWAEGGKFLQVEMNLGEGFILIGTQQLMSVPYALYAASSGSSLPGPQGPPGDGFSEGTSPNQIMYWNGLSWVTLNPGSNGQVLTMCDGGLTWTNGGICPPVISGLNCTEAIISGEFYVGTFASGVTATIPYTGGNGANFSPQSITSTGVTGLTASINGGQLEIGNGLLDLSITGTPNSLGTATFDIQIGGQSCALSFDISNFDIQINSSTIIQVCFSVVHNWVSDLGFYLVGPPSCGSPRIELSPSPGTTCNEGDNVANLCFSNASADIFDVCSAATPLSGTFGSNATTGQINWTPIMGCYANESGWAVQVYDCVSQDSGFLNGATLIFVTPDNNGNLQSTVYETPPGSYSPINDNSCSPETASIIQFFN